MAAIGLLFKHLLGDWKSARATDGYINNTTPMEKLKYNSVFFLISACMALVVVFFLYLVMCGITITPPFD